MKKVLLVALGLIFSATFVMAELDYSNLRDRQVVVDYEDVMNSRGDYFSSHQYGTLAIGASTYYLIDLTTATKNVYLTYDIVASSGNFSMRLSHTPAVASSGTITTSIFNYNQTNPKPSIMTAHLYINGNIGSSGTLLEFNISAVGEIYSPPVTWILPFGKAYLLSVTNESSFVNKCGIRLRWFEK